MNGPGYTIQDLIFYSGLILGIVIVYQFCVYFFPEIHYILRLVLGFGVGIGLGWGGTYLYEMNRRRPPRDPDDPF